jgi:putative FmdB family regulatory protein
MPIYGYACKECGHTLDALQKMADDPLVDCPECGEPALKRQLSAPRFRLKGQGWYETDFKKDNQRNIAGEKDGSKAEGNGDATTDAKSESKSDTKTDTKSDSKSESKSSESSTTTKTPDSKPAKKVGGDKPGAT